MNITKISCGILINILYFIIVTAFINLGAFSENDILIAISMPIVGLLTGSIIGEGIAEISK